MCSRGRCFKPDLRVPGRQPASSNMSSSSSTHASPCSVGSYRHGERQPLVRAQPVSPDNGTCPVPNRASSGTVVTTSSPTNQGNVNTATALVTPRPNQLCRPSAGDLTITIPYLDYPTPVYLGTLADHISAGEAEASHGPRSSGYQADDDGSWGTSATMYEQEDRAAWSSADWIAYFAEPDVPPVGVSHSLAPFDFAMRVAIGTLALALVILTVMYAVLFFVVVFSHEWLSGWYAA